MNINDLRRLDLNLLLIFDALVTEQNVSRAAKRVFLSQPAMSNALSRLRDMLDDPLLIRDRRGMQPTPRARQLTAPVRAILNQIARTIQPPPPFAPASAKTRFVIAMNDYGECIVLPMLAAALRRLAPGVELATQTLSAADSEPGLASGETHVMIAAANYMTGNSTYVNSEPWFDDDWTCLMASKHPLAKQRMTLKRYLTQSHVYPSPLGLRDNIVDNWLAAQNVQRHIAVTTRSYWAAARIVAQGDALLTVPRRIAVSLVNALDLCVQNPPGDLPKPQFSLNYHRIYEKDPATLWLLGVLRSLEL